MQSVDPLDFTLSVQISMLANARPQDSAGLSFHQCPVRSENRPLAAANIGDSVAKVNDYAFLGSHLLVAALNMPMVVRLSLRPCGAEGLDTTRVMWRDMRACAVKAFKILLAFKEHTRSCWLGLFLQCSILFAFSFEF